MGANVSVQQSMFSMIADWQQSGLTQKGWCEQQGIKYHVFHYWYKRWRSLHSSTATENVFVPLAVHGFSTSAACVELLLTDGRRLLFHQPVGPDYLKALIN